MGAKNTTLSKSKVLTTGKTTEKKCWWKRGKIRKTVKICAEVHSGVSQVHKTIIKEHIGENYHHYEKREVKIIKSNSKNNKPVQEKSSYIPCDSSNKNHIKKTWGAQSDYELPEGEKHEKHSVVIGVEDSRNVLSCNNIYSESNKNNKATEKPSLHLYKHCQPRRCGEIAKIKPITLSAEYYKNETVPLNQSVLSNALEKDTPNISMGTLLDPEPKAYSCDSDCETHIKQIETGENIQYSQTQSIKPLKEIDDEEEYRRNSGDESSSMRYLKTIDSDLEESDGCAVSEKEFSSSYPDSYRYISGSSQVLHLSDDCISVSSQERVLDGDTTCSSLKQTHKLSREHCRQSIENCDIALKNLDASSIKSDDSKDINGNNNTVCIAEANAAKENIGSTGDLVPQIDSNEICTEKCVMDSKKTDAEGQQEMVASSDLSEGMLKFLYFICLIYIFNVQCKQKFSNLQAYSFMGCQYYNSEISDLDNYVMGIVIYIYIIFYVTMEVLEFEVTDCENDEIQCKFPYAEHPEGKSQSNKRFNRFSDAEIIQKTVKHTFKSVVPVDCVVNKNDLEKKGSETKNVSIEEEIKGSTNIIGMSEEIDKGPESNETKNREETDTELGGADCVETKNNGFLETHVWNTKESNILINNRELTATNLKLSESVVKAAEEEFRISSAITKVEHEFSTGSICQTARQLKSKNLIMKSLRDKFTCKSGSVHKDTNKNMDLKQTKVEKDTCKSMFKIGSEREFSAKMNVAKSDQEYIEDPDKSKSSVVSQTFGEEKTFPDYRNEGQAKAKKQTKTNQNRKKRRASKVGSTRGLDKDKDLHVRGEQEKHTENLTNSASVHLAGNLLFPVIKPKILSKKAVSKWKIPLNSRCKVRKKFKKRRKKCIKRDDDTDISYTSTKYSVAVSTAKFCQNCHNSNNKPHKACSGCFTVRSELDSRNIQCHITIDSDSGVSSLLTSARSFILSEMENMKNYTLSGRKETKENILRRFLKLGLLELELKNITKGINTEWLARIDHNVIAFPGLESYFDSIRNGATPSLQERMAYEWLRLMSFSSYNGGGCPVHLARGGFYHSHNNETRCFSCSISYSNWQYTDDVQAVHRRISPNCPFVAEGTESNGNISIEARSTENQSSLAATNFATSSSQQPAFAQPAGNAERRGTSHGGLSFSAAAGVNKGGQLTAESITSAKPNTSGADVTRPLTIQQSAGRAQQPADEPVPENPVRVPTQPSQIPRQTDGDAQLTVSAQHQSEGSGRQQNAAGNQGASGSSTTRQPENADNIQLGQLKHPRYSSMAVRMSSFASWPSYLNQTPRQMAYAGFFHPGVADFARCFCCGGGLRNWEADDDPMVEHARWYPKCEYVNKLKGPHFIQAVLRRHREHMAERQREQEAVETSFTSPDPMTTDVAAGLLEMGFTRDRAREAILTVRRLRGRAEVSIEEVTAWMLDDDGESNRAGGREDIAGTGQRSEQQREPSPPNSASGSIESSATTQGASSDSQRSTEEPQGATGGGEQQVEDKGAKDKLDSSSADESSRSKEDKSSSSKKSKSKKDKKSKTKKAHSPSASHGDIDTKSLKEENKQLKQMQVCKICMDQYVSVTFLPCGHLVCCDGCARNMRKCPICRKRIKGQVKTFMS